MSLELDRLHHIDPSDASSDLDFPGAMSAALSERVGRVVGYPAALRNRGGL